MDFEQLRIFLVLAEEGTFLGAATRLETSRSRVRRKLEQLERAAGTALVSRDPGGMKLTPAGRALTKRGSALLAEADQLISHVHEVGEVPGGCLKIAMPIGPPPEGWHQTRRILAARYPNLRAEVIFAERPTQLLPARAEIALTYDEEIPVGCEIFELGRFPTHLFVTERYSRTHGTPPDVEDLENHRVAIWHARQHQTGQLPLRDGRSLKISPHFESNDPGLLFRMAIDGDCICLLPELPCLMDPSLKVLLAESIEGSVHSRLVVPDIVADLPRVQQFVALSQQGQGLEAH